MVAPDGGIYNYAKSISRFHHFFVLTNLVYRMNGFTASFLLFDVGYLPSRGRSGRGKGLGQGAENAKLRKDRGPIPMVRKVYYGKKHNSRGSRRKIENL